MEPSRWKEKNNELGTASFKLRMEGCFARALIVLRSLPGHGSNMPCRQEDRGLGRFSKEAVSTAALGPHLKRAPSRALGFIPPQMSKESSLSEMGVPTHGEPWTTLQNWLP